MDLGLLQGWVSVTSEGHRVWAVLHGGRDTLHGIGAALHGCRAMLNGGSSAYECKIGVSSPLEQGCHGCHQMSLFMIRDVTC